MHKGELILGGFAAYCLGTAVIQTLVEYGRYSMNDITRERAQELVSGQLGRDYTVGTLGQSFLVFAGPKVIGVGGSYRYALEAAGVDVDDENDKRKFVGIGANIMRGREEHIATARSATMAKRIANALNYYVPGRRGL